MKGENISEPGIPEAFKVLLKELQSLALDVKVLTESGDELIIKEFEDEEPRREEVKKPIAEMKDEDFEELDFNVDDEDDDEELGDEVALFDDEDDDDEDGFLDDGDEEFVDDEEDDDDFGFGNLFGSDDDDED